MTGRTSEDSREIHVPQVIRRLALVSRRTGRKKATLVFVGTWELKVVARDGIGRVHLDLSVFISNLLCL